MSMRVDPDQDQTAGFEYDDPGDGAASSGAWLQASPSGGALATEAPREWVFPNGDELFRSIYTRAAAGFGRAEVVAVSSAINGEGKTTVGVGLAVTLAQDFPDRRVLLVETD